MISEGLPVREVRPPFGEPSVGLLGLTRTHPLAVWLRVPPNLRRAPELDAAYRQGAAGDDWTRLPCWLYGPAPWGELIGELESWVAEQNQRLEAEFPQVRPRFGVVGLWDVSPAGRAFYLPERAASAVAEPPGTAGLFTFDTASWQPRKPPHAVGGEGAP